MTYSSLIYYSYMVILFVSRKNICRSQMAEELFNNLDTGHIGLSAGTDAGAYKDKKLADISPETVEALKDKGIDASKKTPIPLTEELAAFAQKIIVLSDRKHVPAYVTRSEKTEYWDIENPEGKDYEFLMLVRARIERLVTDLSAKIPAA